MRLAMESADPRRLSPQVRALMQKTMSPLCGVTKSLGVFLGNADEPRFVVAGAELTGMHIIQNRNPPSRSMHIGGCGASTRESFLPALAEALERYAQLWAGMRQVNSDRFCSHTELRAAGVPVVDLDKLVYFTDEQHADNTHPFAAPDPDKPMSWSRGLSLVDGRRIYAPSHLLFLGYTPRVSEGEPWLAPAVTTGTAVHVTPLMAYRNALLELAQLDCAMGHWYGGKRPVRVRLDKRTPSLRTALERLVGPACMAQAIFYLLPNADLTVFTAACLMSDPDGLPAAVVGLGSDMRLESALYKALAESSGIYQLAKLVLLQELDSNGGQLPEIDTNKIYDLDLNVVYYAMPQNAGLLRARFTECDEASASDLPPDASAGPGPDIARLGADFRETGKELLYYDLTTADLRQAGFYAARVWSPDTISLSLPSAPVFGHHRLKAYGGPFHEPGVHPYP